MACLQIFWIPIDIGAISARFSWRVGDPTFPIVSKGHNPGMYFTNGVEHAAVKLIFVNHRNTEAQAGRPKGYRRKKFYIPRANTGRAGR